MRNSMRRSAGTPALRSIIPCCTSIAQTHRVHYAAELHNGTITGALDDAAIVHGDYGINQIAADRPEPRQRTVFVRAGEPAVTDHVRD